MVGLETAVDPAVIGKYILDVDSAKSQCRENRHRNYEQKTVTPYSPGNPTVKAQCSGCGDVYDRPPTEGEIAFTPF